VTPRKSKTIDRFTLRRFLHACRPDADNVYVRDNGDFIIKTRQYMGGHVATRCDVAARYSMGLEDPLVYVNVDRRVRLTAAGVKWLQDNAPHESGIVESSTS